MFIQIFDSLGSSVVVVDVVVVVVVVVVVDVVVSGAGCTTAYPTAFAREMSVAVDNTAYALPLDTTVPEGGAKTT